MREILFRGKRLDNGEWVYGYYICKQDPLLPGIDKNVIVTFDENSMSVWNKVDPSTVGQYTGLTDKNNVKIFKGDILRCLVPVYKIGQAAPVGDRWLIGVVIWNDTYSREPGSWELDAHDEHGNPKKYIFSSKFEVIGNIFDNKLE